MLKWLDKKFNESAQKEREKEELENQKRTKSFMKYAINMAKENDIQSAIYTVWNVNSAIIITEDFLYFHGSTSRGSWTLFHRGEAIALNKIVSVESDYDSDYGHVKLRFVDGGERYIKTFDNTKELSNFFKRKAIEN